MPAMARIDTQPNLNEHATLKFRDALSETPRLCIISIFLYNKCSMSVSELPRLAWAIEKPLTSWNAVRRDDACK